MTRGPHAGVGALRGRGRTQSVNCYKCYRVSCICRARPSDVCTDAPVPAGFVNTHPGAVVSCSGAEGVSDVSTSSAPHSQRGAECSVAGDVNGHTAETHGAGAPDGLCNESDERALDEPLHNSQMYEEELD